MANAQSQKPSAADEEDMDPTVCSHSFVCLSSGKRKGIGGYLVIFSW